MPPSGRRKDTIRALALLSRSGFRLRLARDEIGCFMYRYGFEIYSRLYWTATLLWAR